MLDAPLLRQHVQLDRALEFFLAVEVADASIEMLTKIPRPMLASTTVVFAAGRIGLRMKLEGKRIAEIFAGALIDNQRVIAVGTRTFGKGRNQEKIALPPGQGGIMLSTGIFRRPNGKTFDKHDAGHADDAGIAPMPDNVVTLAPPELASWRQDMERLDGPFLLAPEELGTKQPDVVLARGVAVLTLLVSARK